MTGSLATTAVWYAQEQNTAPLPTAPSDSVVQIDAKAEQSDSPMIQYAEPDANPPAEDISGAELARQMHLDDLDNPFSMNYSGSEEAPTDTQITIDYERACQLADELGEIESVFKEETGDLARCETTISRPVSNEKIQVEVLAYKGNTENIAATVWLNQDMTARQAILTYEQVFQYLAYQFSRDTLSQDIYRIENKNQVHFRSAGGHFVGLLSYSYAHLQFSYSR